MASEENQIRKFRKKLRQIEHLESLRRELTPNELKKITTKDSIRAQLQILLSQIIQESETPAISHVSRSRFKLTDFSREQSYAGSTFASEPSQDVPLAEHDIDRQMNSRSESSLRKRKRDESGLETLQNENNENRINGKQPREEIMPVEQQNATENVTPVATPTIPSSSVSNEDTRNKYRELEKAKVAVNELKGHSDIVWTLASDLNFIVSGSRDTTARVWDAETGDELCSLRGHTGSVTGVALLPTELSQELSTKLECSEASQIAFTASTDCSIRLWSIPSGKQLKFLYAFNSITCLGVIEHLFYAVTGTDGGKVEVWDVVANTAVYSSKAHGESISCLEVKGSQFCSGSVDGMVIIWTVVDKKVQVLYQLDPNTNAEIPHLNSIASHYGRLFLGDDRANIKVLSWRRDRMHAVRNHPRNYGCTNALTTFEDILVSSGYNLDSGLGSVNIRLLPEVEYICSIHEKAQKILCLSCTWNKDGGLRIVSGGEELLIWNFVDASYKQNIDRYNAAEVLDVCHLDSLDYEPEKIESEEESSELTEGSQDLCDENLTDKQNTISTSIQVEKTSWTSWCSLV